MQEPETEEPATIRAKTAARFSYPYGTPEDWATESLEAARVAYCLPGTGSVMKSGTRLGEDYCLSTLPIVQKQLAKAGIRVAAVLNEIFR